MKFSTTVKQRPPPIIIPNNNFSHKPITIITKKSQSIKNYGTVPSAPKGYNDGIKTSQVFKNSVMENKTKVIKNSVVENKSNDKIPNNSNKKKHEGCFPDCFKYCI
tara:strand:+ start:1554 stop:1871 length:318 start_codon:yes stop_codon:yes gene_type:complete